jgi:hypothetical protein
MKVFVKRIHQVSQVGLTPGLKVAKARLDRGFFSSVGLRIRQINRDPEFVSKRINRFGRVLTKPPHLRHSLESGILEWVVAIVFAHFYYRMFSGCFFVIVFQWPDSSQSIKYDT